MLDSIAWIVGFIAAIFAIFGTNIFSLRKPFSNFFTFIKSKYSSKVNINNPFGKSGRIDNDLYFFKRDFLLSNIFNELKKGQSVELIADEQIGKSSILSHICRNPPDLNKHAIYIDFNLMQDDIDFFTFVCRKLNIPMDKVRNCRGSELSDYLMEKGQKYILCLDKIERLTTDKFPVDMRNELRGISEGENTPFTLLISTSKPLKEIFPDTGIDSSPLANICRAIRVEPFSEKEVTGLIQQYLTGQPISFSETDIKTIFEQSQGHPHNIQELAYALYEQKAATLRGKS